MGDRIVREDAWGSLRALTAARIALGSVGAGIPTARQLDFQLDHARARDAVHAALDTMALRGRLAACGLPVLLAHSAAADRAEYLRRPDLGRRLDDASSARLARSAAGRHEAVLVVADGLSALAVQRHAAPLVTEVVQRLRAAGWGLGPVVLVEQGRVAIGDAVGELLGAEIVAVLIGERPGLSSPDALSVYLTHGPRPGRLDSERNCISGIRPEGLACSVAAARLVWLMTEARRRALTGIHLRDESSTSGAAVPRPAAPPLPLDP
jgi:ethanolamine ammonia-lyase small subunit